MIYISVTILYTHTNKLTPIQTHTLTYNNTKSHKEKDKILLLILFKYLELTYLLHFRYEPEFAAPILYVWIPTETRLVNLGKSASSSYNRLVILTKSASSSYTRLVILKKSAISPYIRLVKLKNQPAAHTPDW